MSGVLLSFYVDSRLLRGVSRRASASSGTLSVRTIYQISPCRLCVCVCVTVHQIFRRRAALLSNSQWVFTFICEESYDTW